MTWLPSRSRIACWLPGLFRCCSLRWPLSLAPLSSVSYCCWVLGVVSLLNMTYLVFVSPAIIGIGKASEFNPCSTVNATRCIPVTEIRAAVGAEAPPSQTDEPNSREFLYWLAGATGCGVLFAIIATLAFWALEDVVRRIKK